ncbi:hypothetical protein PV396_18665 [Streptomyces sp. ME02-8801-2C]|uniref:hypothetical protein n=1 Tax=Streptomyces sp. ME02-8801-2C TaxID=3028680 RepID=UPI0029A40464|nr:hypothetical protein [Streptomyces sp. ME02-8801-2C]MDX3453945.1 hypothetical protein [Streptomyces sp. ME02-8801-2C]
MKNGRVWVGDEVYDHEAGQRVIVTDVRGGMYLLRPLHGGGQEWTAEGDNCLEVKVSRVEGPDSPS